MSLLQEYQYQFNWRPWPQIFAELPDIVDQHILDLGCGPGDLSTELVSRGAHVLGLDGNAELLAYAQQRALPQAEFKLANLTRLDQTLPDQNALFDGIWCSFVAAYFTQFADVLTHWKAYLKPGGWIALTEIDDFFGHQPLSELSQTYLQQNVANALQANRYDFNMGHKMGEYLKQTGFNVLKQRCFADSELSFAGPASADVVQAWAKRLQRMGPLQALCGDDFESLQADFLNCLQSPTHTSQAKVYFYLAKLVS